MPKCGGVKQEKTVRTTFTREDGDTNTRVGKGTHKAGVGVSGASGASGASDQDMVMGRVETYYGRKRTIESIMSGGGEGETLGGSLGVAQGGSKAGAVAKRQTCLKRKSGHKGITSVSSSSSSSSEEDDESGDGEESDIHDGTDVLDYESKVTVIPSSEIPHRSASATVCHTTANGARIKTRPFV